MRAVLAGLILAAILGGPAPAQSGRATGAPSNPFASNYPSELPPRLRPVTRGDRGAARLRHRRAPAAEGPIPPRGDPGTMSGSLPPALGVHAILLVAALVIGLIAVTR